MTLKEILDRARGLLADTQEPFLWEDQELVDYLNDSINKAAEVCKVFVDSVTAAICQIAVLDHDASPDYALDPRVLIIRSARLSSQTRPLTRKTSAELDAMNPDWRNATKGTPQYFCTDYSEGLITLSPGSSIDDTLNLSVFRLPLTQMVLSPSAAGPPATGLYASPEINFRHHFRLLDGILSWAYRKDDTETLDPEKALRHENYWRKHLSGMTMGRIRLHETETFAGPFRGIK